MGTRSGRLGGPLGLGPLAGPAGLAVARARHPSSVAARPDALPLARRLCERLAARGAPEPEVGVAVAATRGAWGLDPARFGGLVGIDPTSLTALEAGQVALGEVPAVLLAAEPFGPIVARLRAAALDRVAGTDDRR